MLEIHKRNGKPYPPNTLYQLYQLICGLIIIPTLQSFHSMLDGEMKQLNSTGKYLAKKQTQPITVEQENCLWELGLLGDNNAQVLLITIKLASYLR